MIAFVANSSWTEFRFPVYPGQHTSLYLRAGGEREMKFREMKEKGGWDPCYGKNHVEWSSWKAVVLRT
jgi:hypothetical protein